MLSKIFYESMIILRPHTMLNRNDPRMHKLYTGSSFNKEYRSARFVKVLDKTMIHYNFEYKEGLNVDTKMFVEDPMRCNNGLYFFRLPRTFIWNRNYTVPNNLGHYMALYGDLVADVKIPDNAKIAVEDSVSFKADRIILSNIRNVHTLFSPELRERLTRKLL